MGDLRMQAMGGMKVPWEIWERSIVPPILANCGSGNEILKPALNALNYLQTLY